MPAAIGPRFVLEAGFLILLAVVVGLAELSPALIVLVMAVGWLLVALIEYFAWRQSAGFTTVQRYAVAEGAPPGPVAQEMTEDPAPPPTPPPPATPPPATPEPDAPPTETPEPTAPEPAASEPVTPEPDTPPPAEEETMVATPQDEPGDVEEVIDFRPEHEINYRLDPLKPRPSRRWIFFGPRVRREDDREEER
jgi:outer membrane biosynthesis protein TonB